jgi:hypothetical protein
MPTISNTNAATGSSSAFIATWSPLANGDDGTPVRFSQYADKSVQVSGIFGVGGSLRLEGSNNGTDYAVLTDPQGNPLDFTSAKVKAVTEATLWVRPRVTGGDGTTNLTVSVLMKE